MLPQERPAVRDNSSRVGKSFSQRLLQSVAAVALACLASAALVSRAATDEAKLKAYGRHLAQECTSCHRIDGIDNGIPSIVGWPAETFITTIKFYREGTRTNAVMVSVAGSLNDRQIDALAAFFASLPKPPVGGPAAGKKLTK
jgi:cytochrome c553